MRFLEKTLKWPCWGDPEYTFSDVERAIQQEVRKRNYLARYQLRVAEAERAREMETLRRSGGQVSCSRQSNGRCRRDNR